MKLVIASRNKGKIKEIKKIFEAEKISITLMGLDEFPFIESVPEPADTFEGNALFKAKYVCEKTGLVVLSDDSGLEVDALNGRPGVYSARFAGEDATDEKNNKKLLELMKDIEDNKRGAQFRCVMVLYSPTGDYVLTQGIWRGKIALSPQGDRGFGYDPIFYDESLGKCAATLSSEEKNQVSHRGKALKKLIHMIVPFFKIIGNSDFY